MYVGGVDDSSKGADRLMSGGMFASSYGTLFPSYTKMTGYDIIMLQCEGSQFANEKMPFLGNMKRYADNGGRVFADHLHSSWIRTGLPPWRASEPAVGRREPAGQHDYDPRREGQGRRSARATRLPASQGRLGDGAPRSGG
jgi:hypothetical protein